MTVPSEHDDPRRPWTVVATAAEVPPGTVRPVRLGGEDFALFRTADGALGLLSDRCPHRGASLAGGIVVGATLACPHHGWRFGTDGRCVAMPGEGDDPRRLARGTTRAAAVAEHGGDIVADLGPPPPPAPPAAAPRPS